MAESVELSVVLPVFNEEKNVWLLAERYAEISKDNNLEVIFVEDSGSTDNTRAELQNVAEKYPFVKNVFTNQRGYGISIHNGLKQAQGEYVCWTHADLQTDPHDTVKALKIILSKKNPEKWFIKGDRKKRPFLDQFFTTGMSIFETLMLLTPLRDINAQPNLFHHSFLEQIPNPPQDFSFDLYCYYIAKKRKYQLQRFPVLFTARIHGQSSWNNSLADKWKFIKRTIKFTTKMKNNL